MFTDCLDCLIFADVFLMVHGFVVLYADMHRYCFWSCPHLHANAEPRGVANIDECKDHCVATENCAGIEFNVINSDPTALMKAIKAIEDQWVNGNQG